MVIAALNKYQAFQLTKAVLDPVPVDNLCAKVGQIAMKILLTPLLILTDLILFPIALIHRACYPAPTPYLPVHPDRIPIPINQAPIQPPPPQAEPEQQRLAELKRLQESRDLFNNRQNLGGAPFYDHALDFAFRFLSEEKVTIYKEMIVNDGDPDEGEAPIEIFRWAAGCFLIHYACLKHQHPETPFRIDPQGIDGLLNSYDNLPPPSRAKVALKIIDVDCAVQLNQAELALLRQIQAVTGDFMTTQQFLAHWPNLAYKNN